MAKKRIDIDPSGPKSKLPNKVVEQAAKLPNDVGKAIEKIYEQPTVDTGKKGELIAVPFPVDTKPPFKVTPKSVIGAVHQKVKLKDLTATQPTVYRKRVVKFAKEDARYSPIPVVVKVHGQYWINNGHHRCSAAHWLGKEDLRCNVLDLKDGG